ncbi:MOP flippase family protein [Cohnella nanjingensis]|uniref:MOP flippase family protein n=1 Tax=Cohnella nanjingensis TaxID=1387779 RepID=A0A7X0RSL7_9BACL|nr:MOP flippase family protein [Cohnella nanjingensis]MBB6671716.1 MOP flippase family protein [Cohnella nanjingensis]
MSLRVRGINAAKWSSLATAVSTVIQLAQVVTISRMLSPEDYGLISMIMVVVMVAIAMSDFGISNAIIHRQRVTKNELSSLYLLNLGAGAAIALAVWLLAPVAAYYYQEPQLVGPMRWMALLCFFPAIGQQFQVLFQKELRFAYLAKVDIASYAVGFATVFIGAYLGFGVYALVGSYLANALFKALCLAVAGWRIWPPGLRLRMEDLKGYLSFGVYQMGSGMIQSFMTNIDYLILGPMIGAEKLGYYTFAYQLCIMPMQKLSPLVSQISLPLLAKIQDQSSLLRKGYLQITEMISYVTGPIYLGLAVTAPYLVPFAFGKQWTDSILMVQILAIMFLVRSAVIPTHSLLLAIGRANTRFYYSILCFAILLPSLWLGARLNGALGVAYAYLIAQALIVLVNYYQSIRIAIGNCFAAYCRSMMPGVLYSTLMAIGVFALGAAVSRLDSDLLIVALQLAFGVVLYGALIYGFNRSLVQDVKQRLRARPFKKGT